MRKYRQLLLVIISIASISLFLIYRHEYNRLHYVLEVFSFFGKPCNLTDLINSDTVTNQYDWGPYPLWNQDDNLYYYSHFWVSSHESQSIVLGDARIEHAKNCYLWYDDEKEPVMGKFKYSQIGSTTDAYHYFCSSNNDKTPYAVSYIRNNKRNMKKHVLNENRKGITFNTTVCVATSPDFTKLSFIEFLSFHALIGVDSFIIYSNSLPYKTVKTILNLTSVLGFNITFYDFNYPKENSNLIRLLVENDCLLRTINQSKHVVTLNVNEYIVPSTHYYLNEVFANFNAHSDRLNLAVQKFCIVNADPREPIAVQNTDTIYDNENAIQVVYKNNHDNNVISAQGVDKGSMSLHKYIYCHDDGYKTYKDASVMRFSKDFIRSTLIRYLVGKQI